MHKLLPAVRTTVVSLASGGTEDVFTTSRLVYGIIIANGDAVTLITVEETDADGTFNVTTNTIVIAADATLVLKPQHLRHRGLSFTSTVGASTITVLHGNDGA